MKTPFAIAICAASLMAADVPPPRIDLPSGGRVATAVLAGGSFWTMQAVYERLRGVIAAVAGYAGGKAEDAHETQVGAGKTKHAEAIQITYDPSQISYGKLLQVFFAVAHDPTEINRQGPDAGPGYRSVIFYSTDGQKQVAQAYISQIQKARVFHGAIATDVTLLTGFYPAEEHHQQYARQNPNDPYVAQNIVPKVKALEQQFPDLVKP